MKTERPIPQEVLDRFLAFMLEPAAETISEGGQVVPIMIAERLDDAFKLVDIKMIGFVSDGKPPTAIIGKLINQLLVSRDYDMIAFINEAWTKTAKPDERIPDSIAEDPERTESVVVIVYTRQGEWLSISPIKRSPNRLEVRPFSQDIESFGGRLSIHGVA